jgi:hypothetical protein
MRGLLYTETLDPGSGRVQTLSTALKSDRVLCIASLLQSLSVHCTVYCKLEEA